MPRLPRIDLPGIPQHVVQRGNNRLPCFFREQDYERYLDDLREIALKRACRVHAYVLMTNHVHLLVTPDALGAISSMMQALGRRYVRWINDRYGRTGTLWEGRHKAGLVDSDDHLLKCYRYIELNPVRAGMVEDPADYRWSSYRANALGSRDLLVSPHPSYVALGASIDDRMASYRALVAEALTEEDLASIRQYLQRQQALGSPRFQDRIEAQLARRVRPGQGGRPRSKRT